MRISEQENTRLITVKNYIKDIGYSFYDNGLDIKMQFTFTGITMQIRRIGRKTNAGICFKADHFHLIKDIQEDILQVITILKDYNFELGTIEVLLKSIDMGYNKSELPFFYKWSYLYSPTDKTDGKPLNLAQPKWTDQYIDPDTQLPYPGCYSSSDSYGLVAGLDIEFIDENY